MNKVIRNVQTIWRWRAPSALRCVPVPILGMMFALGACHNLTSADASHPGLQDPSVYQTPSGAERQAKGAVSLMRSALASFVFATGSMSDELIGGERQDVAAALVPDAAGSYDALQQVRGQSYIARAALTSYAPNAPAARRAEMYALEGYADVYLADLFCSGIPLSTVHTDGTFTYAPGSKTIEVYHTAAALFDSAITLAGDSARIETLARVGLARALLAIGARDSAAHVVAHVADTAAYRLRVRLGGWFNAYGTIDVGAWMSDQEGGNGLPYITSRDPRTPDSLSVATVSQQVVTRPIFAPYAAAISGDSVSITVASGVEARLIEAEAVLAHGDTAWLGILNRLRTTGAFTVTDVYTCDVPRDPGTGACVGDSTFTRRDTLWEAGTGGIAGLRPLKDPGAALTGANAVNARVNLLFAERGYWLYLTGHRQGDLRRLVRAPSAGGYGRPQQTVYPVGLDYFGRPYGNEVSVRVPVEESRNPRYQGCFDHAA